MQLLISGKKIFQKKLSMFKKKSVLKCSLSLYNNYFFSKKKLRYLQECNFIPKLQLFFHALRPNKVKLVFKKYSLIYPTTWKSGFSFSFFNVYNKNDNILEQTVVLLPLI